MSGFIDDLRDAGPLRAVGLHNRTDRGLRQAARMARRETWVNHLLQLRNDLREALSCASAMPPGGWNAAATRVGARIDAEIVPPMRRWAKENGLDEMFVQTVRYAVMTAAMDDEWRDHARMDRIQKVADALLAGRLPCGVRNSVLVSY